MSSVIIKLVSAIAVVLLLVSCTSKPKPTIDIVYKTKYVEVPVIVSYPIIKPNRPKQLKNDTMPSYLLKVLTYTKTLEILIDEHNKGIKECAIDKQ